MADDSFGGYDDYDDGDYDDDYDAIWVGQHAHARATCLCCLASPRPLLRHHHPRHTAAAEPDRLLLPRSVAGPRRVPGRRRLRAHDACPAWSRFVCIHTRPMRCYRTARTAAAR